MPIVGQPLPESIATRPERLPLPAQNTLLRRAQTPPAGRDPRDPGLEGIWNGTDPAGAMRTLTMYSGGEEGYAIQTANHEPSRNR